MSFSSYIMTSETLRADCDCYRSHLLPQVSENWLGHQLPGGCLGPDTDGYGELQIKVIIPMVALPFKLFQYSFCPLVIVMALLVPR